MENFGTLKENELLIHSLESFGTVDGPGIRYVVFLQGCPIQCKFCHNRDTWEFESNTKMTIEDIENHIKKYLPYIKNSGGGVTFTGGEPLLQAKNLIPLLKNLKKKKVHIALDTAGSLPITNTIAELLEYVDLVLLDIKHMNEKKCIELTGHSNKHSLDFAEYLKNHNIPVWIRHVIVPGITDEMSNILELKQYLATLTNLEKVELLPYHDMGKFKWSELGLEYPLEGIRTANADDVAKIKEILEIDY